MAKLTISGFKELEQMLKGMEKKAQNLQVTHQIPFNELFTPSFMIKNTKFSSIDEFIEAGNFKEESFEDIPAIVLNNHIAANSCFKNWDEMIDKATSLYVAKKLGLD